MKAIAIDRFGETPTLREMPTPEIGPGEVLLRMKAAGVNPMDWKVRDGVPAEYGQESRFPLILGLEGSAVVERVADDVDRFSPGDAVFGLFWPAVFEHGTFADYLVVSADARMALKPDALSFEQAAVLPLAGGAGLGVVEWLGVGPGSSLLVIGATGGVGSYAVQIAAARGARVVATASAADADYIRGLGAQEVIDFETEDTIEAARRIVPEGFDAILDVVSDQAQLERVAGLARKGGRLLTTLWADVDALAEQGVTAHNFLNHPMPEHFTKLAEMVEAGDLQIHIQQAFPLEDAVEALRLSEQQQVRGKLVLTI